MAAPNPKGIYFNAKGIGDPVDNYVLWLDVMGTANQMLRSLPISANFIFKLHCAVLEAYEETGKPNSIRLYAMMDGMYVTSTNRGDLQGIVNQSMVRLAITFLNEAKPFHQFLVRGAIAFGPIYHGSEVEDHTAHVLADYRLITDSVLMGLPLAQAYKAEGDAPPFGLAVHSSARAFAPTGDEPFRFIWLDWFNHCNPPVDPAKLLSHLNKYFAWQAKHSHMTGYKLDRMKEHAALSEEFLTAAV